MASASVKSFLIADLLVGQSDNKPTESAISKSSGNGCSVDNLPVDGRGAIDARKLPASTSNSPASTSEDDRSEKSSTNGEQRPSVPLKYDESGPSLAGGFYQYPGFPMVFPVTTLPTGNGGLTSGESGMKNYHPGMVPYPMDPFRHRLMYGRHPGAMALPPFAGLSHGGHLPQGMDYAAYPNFTALYGLGSGGPGFVEKGSLIGDRDNFSMFHLGRPMYAVSCKRKGGQIRFTNSQTALLEKAFVQQKYLNANDRKKLAHSLGLSDRQVKTWFQNRRAKLRKCKGGLCTESEVSGSPKDSRALSPQNENGHFESFRDAKGHPL